MYYHLQMKTMSWMISYISIVHYHLQDYVPG